MSSKPELIPVKSYDKGLTFFVAKKTKYITNYSLKLAKPMPQFNPIFPSILKPSRLARNLSKQKQIISVSSSA